MTNLELYINTKPLPAQRYYSCVFLGLVISLRVRSMTILKLVCTSDAKLCSASQGQISVITQLITPANANLKGSFLYNTNKLES
jgi:hypothetical protein